MCLQNAEYQQNVAESEKQIVAIDLKQVCIHQVHIDPCVLTSPQTMPSQQLDDDGDGHDDVAT